MSEKQYIGILQFSRKTKFRKDTILRFCKRTPWLLTGIYICFIGFLAITADNRIVLFTAVPLVDLAIVTTLRFLLGRPRPFEMYRIEPLIRHSGGNSCPSRHTSSAFIIGMACLFINIPFGILSLCMACIVGATRILCGLHFLLDVLVGAGISIILGVIGFYVLPLFIILPTF